jgi:hypothetical protein
MSVPIPYDPTVIKVCSDAFGGERGMVRLQPSVVGDFRQAKVGTDMVPSKPADTLLGTQGRPERTTKSYVLGVVKKLSGLP